MDSLQNYETQTGGFLFGLNKCSKNNDVFLKAYRKGKFESMKFMLDNDLVTDFAHGDRYGNTILHYAVVNEDVDFIRYLINHIGNDKKVLNQGNNKGDTPLHVAVRKGLTDIADILINNGSCPNKKNNEGERVQKKELVEEPQLLEMTTNMNIRDTEKYDTSDLLFKLAKNNKLSAETPISARSVFITSDSSNTSPVRKLQPNKMTLTEESKKLDNVSVKDTEELFELLKKFNLDNMSGGGSRKISGSRKIYSTLKINNKKSTNKLSGGSSCGNHGKKSKSKSKKSKK